MTDQQIDSEYIYRSFDEVLQVDQQTGILKNNKMVYMNNDQSTISPTGDAQSGGQQIVLSPQCQGSILDLESIMFHFQVVQGVDTQIAINPLAYFQPDSMTLGSFNISYTSQCGTLVQKRLESQCFSREMKQLLGIICDDDFDRFASVGTITDPNSLIIFLKQGSSLISLKDETQYKADCVYSVMNEICTQQNYKQYYTIRMIDMFPDLIKSIGKQVYISKNDQLQFRFRTVSPGDCLIQPLGINVASSYAYTATSLTNNSKFTITNKYVSYNYTPINNSPILQDRLMKSIIQMIPKYWITDSTQLAQTVNLKWQSNSKQLLHGIMVCFPQKSRTLTQAQGIANQAEFYGQNLYSSYTNICPDFATSQVLLSINGNQYTLNNQQLPCDSDFSKYQIMSLNDYQFPGQLYQSQIMNKLHAWRYYDLTKFANDIYGSQNGEANQINLQLQLSLVDIGPFGSRDLSEEKITTALLAEFNCYGFLCVSSPIEYRKGQYYNK